MPSRKPTYFFDEKATYVIAGGLGGIGRSIVRWMVHRKARHLLLLSRSGARSESAKLLLGEMKDLGAQVIAASCDISRENDVMEVVRKYMKLMPQIKGCIQASMVLKVCRYYRSPGPPILC